MTAPNPWDSGKIRGRTWARAASPEDRKSLLVAFDALAPLVESQRCHAVARQIAGGSLLPGLAHGRPANLTELQSETWLAGFVDGAVEAAR